MPAATCSPCRCRKLLAVEAAALASAKDTDEGSLWNAEAVLRAACFCAHVVPSAGAGAAAGAGDAEGEEDDDECSLEKRFVSSFMCDRAGAAPGRGGGGGVPGELVALAGLDWPMPRPGTEMPAAPRRLTAPALTRPALAEEPAELAELVRGGSRGGRLGGPDFDPAVAVW